MGGADENGEAGALSIGVDYMCGWLRRAVPWTARDGTVVETAVINHRLIRLAASGGERKLVGRDRAMRVEVGQHVLPDQPQRPHDVLMGD